DAGVRVCPSPSASSLHIPAAERDPLFQGRSVMDAAEILLAARQARARAMRRAMAALWRRLTGLPDVTHSDVQRTVGVGGGEVAVVAEVDAGALRHCGVGAQ